MKNLLFLFTALIAGVSLTSFAASRTWTGAADDGKYTTAGNWSPAGSPADNDYTDTITFDGNVGTVNIDASRTISSVTIKTTGWVFTGSDLKTKGYKVSADLGEIVASGFGLKSSSTSGYSIGSGTTLLVNNGFSIKDTSTPGLTGGGTLHLKSRFTFECYGAGGSFVVSGDSLLITDQPLANFGGTHSSYPWTIKLNSKDARFICKDSLSNVQAKFETTTKNAWNLSCTYVPENYQLAARELSGDWSGYVEVYLQTTNVPVLESASVARNSGTYEVTALMSQGVDGTTVKAVADDGAGNTVETVYEGALAIGEEFAFELSGLVAEKTYAIKVMAENDSGKSELDVSETFYTGALSLALTVDAYERNVIAGTVTVSRAEASVNPLTVNYQFTGITAEEGVDYEAPSGVITIPAGELSAMIPVKPIMNVARAEDTTLQVSLSAGMYDASAAPVTVTIHDFTIPTDSCVWMGASGVDNNASTASNWYDSKLPTKDDKILLAVFSSSNIVWDAGVNGLPDTVASWEQTADYPGTVTFKTVYPNGDDAAFTNFTVTGDCIVNGGKWTHMANDSAEVYSLNVTVGGNLTIGAGGTITVMGKGYTVGKFPSGSAIGAHAATYTGDSSHIYGDVYAPSRCGSGGFSGNYSASCGGGAIKLTVAGAAVIDGTLDAQSSTQSSTKNGNPEKGVGAGGSIFVTAASISGNGTVIASAYENNGTSYSSEAGSGGRIALVATTGDVTVPNANLKCSGSIGGNGVGGGTIFVKNASDAYGTLLIEDRKAYSVYNYATHWPTKGRFAMVKSGETWTFDRVLLRGRGVLSVPEGSTLVLPNGFASISCEENNSAPNAGILYLGGTIAVPDTATHEISGSWLFQAASPYSFPAGDVVLSDKAAIGCFELHSSGADPTNQPNCDVTVNGNMTIASGSSLLATGRGHRSTVNTPYGGAHGGIGNGMANTKVFDSILHPRYAGGSAGSGNGGVNNNVSGGAIKLTVVGSLTMNGSANVKSGPSSWGNNKAASGSLDITAGSLSGSGSFCADGLVSESTSVLSGAGGRIAIHLTGDGAAFDNFDVTKITANSAMSTGSPAKAGSAGTVYLESGTLGSGTVIVKSTNSGVTTPTPIPSQTWGGEDDDLDKASLSIQSYGIVALTESLKMSALTIGSNAKLDLNGKTFTVVRAKLGDTKLPVGTYAAGDAVLGGFVSDSAGEGSLVVKGEGLQILFR